MLTFKKFLEEGNPLARIHGAAEKGKHMIAISADRAGLSPEENKARYKQLGGDIRASGHGYRRAEGKWEGGKERSYVVHSKSASSEDNRKLIHMAIKLSKKHGQDGFLHNDGKRTHVVGTNRTGDPGYGKRDDIGTLKYNKDNPYGETILKPQKKPPEKRPKFTTG
jgi:hypothetical protein